MQILCATDFSEPAARAADTAAAIAKALHLPLRLVHCIADWPLMVEPMLLLNDHFSNTWRQQLEAEVERLAANGIEVNSDLRRGDASHELIAATAEHPAAMVVMGSTGAGKAERWLLGRVAERVAEGAAVPALVVRNAEPLLSWLAGEKTLRVLCGVDFNLSSDAALAKMKDLSGLGKLEVEAVHIREVKRSRFMGLGAGTSQLEEEDQVNSEADVGRDVWDRVNELLGQPPVRVHVPPASRHADHQMAHLADERETGLLVVGTHQRHGWQRLSHHSFSRGVLTHAATNVLCVPASSTPPILHIPRIHRVLVATDLKSPGGDPLRHALGLLSAGGEIRVLHVVPAPKAGVNPLLRSVTYFGNSMAADKAREAAQSALDLLIASLPPVRKLSVTAEVLFHDDTAEAISSAAEKFGADVICMGTHGHSRAGVAVAGSVMHAVTARCHRPVFVVPPPVA